MVLKAPDPQQEEVNKNILNIIAPSGIEFHKKDLIQNDYFGEILAVTDYPSNPPYGWISKLACLEGVTAKVNFHPINDTSEFISYCDQEIRYLKQELTAVKDESDLQQKEKAVEKITKLIEKIGQGEVMGNCHILLFAQAFSQDLLNERVKSVKNNASKLGFTCRPLLTRQKEAYRSISPYGFFDPVISGITRRNMPISTFIGGYPNADSGLNDGTGFIIGESEGGKLIILDPWKRGDDRINSNWFLSGLPGSGKSTAVKVINLYEYALGSTIMFFDPEKEYRDMVKNLNGNIIDCAGGKTGKINPLQIRFVPDDGEEEEKKGYQDLGYGMGPLALHFQFLRAFFKMYSNALDDLHISRLEEVLERVYQDHGIRFETPVEHLKKLKNTDYPILSELYKELEKEEESAPDDKSVKELRRLLRSICVGSDSYIWNGHTNVEITADAIDFDVSSLIEADEKVKKAQYYNILSFVWHKISENRMQKVVLTVDEGYLFLDPEIPQPMQFLRNVSKRIRKYEGSLIFVTHAPNDVLDEKVRIYGEALLENACFKMLLGCDGKGLEDAKELMKLTDEEENVLLARKRGKGLLVAGSRRMKIHVKVPKKFFELMGTAGGK